MQFVTNFRNAFFIEEYKLNFHMQLTTKKYIYKIHREGKKGDRIFKPTNIIVEGNKLQQLVLNE